MVIKIALHTPNKFVLIDEESYPLVKNNKWYLLKTDNLEYACASIRIVNNKLLKPLTGTQIAKMRKKNINRFNNEPIYPKGTKKYILMHRLIMNFPKGMEIDHINGNGLDNRRCNLRICTRTENGSHRRLSSLNTSGYHGVSYCKNEKRKKRWISVIRYGGRKHTLGRFYTKDEAAIVYNESAKKHHGQFATLNKIETLEQEIYPKT